MSCDALATKQELQDTVASLQGKIDALNDVISGLMSELNILRNDFTNHVTTPIIPAHPSGGLQAIICGLFPRLCSSNDDQYVTRSEFNSHLAQPIPSAHEYNLDLSDYVKKGSGLSVSGSYESGGFNISVSCDVGSDSEFISLFLGDYVEKTDLSNYVLKSDFNSHVSLPIPDAHDYNLDLSNYVLKSDFNSHISQPIPDAHKFDDSGFVKMPEFLILSAAVALHFSQPIPTAHDYDLDLSKYVLKSDFDTHVSQPIPTAHEYNLDLSGYALKSDLANKVDKNQGIAINGSYFNGQLNLIVAADQIGTDSENIPIFIYSSGGGGGFDDDVDDYARSQISQLWDSVNQLNQCCLDFKNSQANSENDKNDSDFQVNWDGENLGFFVKIFGLVFNVGIKIAFPINIELSLTEKPEGEELRVDLQVGNSFDWSKIIMPSSDKIDKIYRILGGNKWFPENSQGFRVKPDDEISAKALGHYDGLSNMNPTGLFTYDLIELIWASQAPNYQKLGLGSYPGKVPHSVIHSKNDDGTFMDAMPANPDGTIEGKSIGSQADFLLWQFEQIDALVGQFPIEIDIEDSSLVEEGNQTKRVAMVNLAEAIAEIYGLLTVNSLQTDVSMNINTRMIPEIIRIRQLGLTNQDLIVAIREFLGFREVEVAREVESNFSLTSIDNFSELLKESTHKYKSMELDQKETVLDYLIRLMYAATIIKSVFLKNQDQVDNAVEKEQTIKTNSDAEWEAFKTAINDPNSFFNLGERPSRLRDIDTDNSGG